MAVNTEYAHWECVKCKNTFDNVGHRNAQQDRCPTGGKHKFNHKPPAWNKSALGATVNLIGKGVKLGANKIAESNSEEAREMRKIKRQRQEEENLIKQEESEKENRELADKTIAIYAVLKPYMKFIIPIYVAIIVITMLLVKDKKIAGILFSLLTIGILYLTYNAIVNRSK